MLNIDSIRIIQAIPEYNHRILTENPEPLTDRYMTRKEVGINTEKNIIKELNKSPVTSCVTLAKRMNMSLPGIQCAVKRLLKKDMVTRKKPKDSRMFFYSVAD